MRNLGVIGVAIASLMLAPGFLPEATARVDPGLDYGVEFLDGLVVTHGEPGVLSAAVEPANLASGPNTAEILVEFGLGASPASGPVGQGGMVASLLEPALPGTPFELRVSGLPGKADVASLQILVQGEMIRVPLSGERVLDVPDVPAVEGQAYTIQILNPQGKVVAEFRDLEIIHAPMFMATQCQPTQTAASESSFKSRVGRQSKVDSTLKALTVGNLESGWKYRSSNTGEKTVSDAYSLGHSYWGANQFHQGDFNDVGFGHSWEGAKDTRQEFVNECRAWITVGHIFTVERAYAFYRDVGGVLATHEKAWEKGRPSEDCGSSLHPMLSSALGLTKYGNYINAAIPDTWCSENWKEIKTDPKGETGLGVQMNRAAQNWYEGGEGFIRTLYSSTGEFNMELEGQFDVRVFANSCGRCTSYNVQFRDGYTLSAPALVVF